MAVKCIFLLSPGAIELPHSLLSIGFKKWKHFSIINDDTSTVRLVTASRMTRKPAATNLKSILSVFRQRLPSTEEEDFSSAANSNGAFILSVCYMVCHFLQMPFIPSHFRVSWISNAPWFIWISLTHAINIARLLFGNPPNFISF